MQIWTSYTLTHFTHTCFVNPSGSVYVLPIHEQVKCEVNLEKTSQEASDGSCSARYMRIENFYKTLTWITNNKLKHAMNLLITRSTIERAKNVNDWNSYHRSHPLACIKCLWYLLISIVRAVHLRALMHLCVRLNAARRCSVWRF